MRIPAIAMVACLLLTPTILGQSTDLTVTDGLDNGRLWAKMDLGEKVQWVRGYQDGLKIGAQILGNLPDADWTPKASQYFPTILTFGEITGIAQPSSPSKVVSFLRARREPCYD